MSAASKHEVTQLTPTIRLALYVATYSMAELLGRPIVVFYCSCSYWWCYSNNEASANAVNVVKSRRDLWCGEKESIQFFVANIL